MFYIDYLISLTHLCSIHCLFVTVYRIHWSIPQLHSCKSITGFLSNWHWRCTMTTTTTTTTMMMMLMMIKQYSDTSKPRQTEARGMSGLLRETSSSIMTRHQRAIVYLLLTLDSFTCTHS